MNIPAPNFRHALRGWHFAALVSCAAGVLVSATAQLPDTLRNIIPPPLTGVQSGEELGYSVAVEGAYAIVGAPGDDTGGKDSGSVKIFEAATGQLHHVLFNPNPTSDLYHTGDRYGASVAVSGTRVVIGAPNAAGGTYQGGAAYIHDLDSDTPAIPIVTLSAPMPSGQGHFGATVAISGSLVVVGVPFQYIDVPGVGIAYVYDLDSTTPAVPVLTLENPSPSQYDAFGIAVAIDGQSVAVGTHGDDTGIYAGRAYVYDLSSATPTVPVAKLAKPNPARFENFGESLAMSGTRLAVGAFRVDAGAEDAGAVYVYDITGVTPTVPVAVLENPSPGVQDFFGLTLAISGTRLVIGAYLDDTVAPNTGIAYLYDLDSATPTVPSMTFTTPNPSSGNFFGSAVGLSGNRLVLGAQGDDTGAEDSGRAYSYDLASASPTVPTASLDDASPSASSQFGYSVAVSGTLVVIGANLDDTGAPSAGSAWVYDLSSATPTVPLVALPNPDPVVEDYFGTSVAIDGQRVVVGASRTEAGAITDAGSAWVYDLGSPTPDVPIAKLRSPRPTSNGRFGCAVAISGPRVVVGARGDGAGVRRGGYAYVYDLRRALPGVPVASLKSPTLDTGARFGFAVAISGPRVVVGAPNDDTSARDAGSAYVYDLRSVTPAVPVAELRNQRPTRREDGFGFAVAIDGSRVVVGAPYADAPQTVYSGLAYVFDLRRPDSSKPVARLRNPTPSYRDFFGATVAVSGARVVVGADGENSEGIEEGIVYLYDLDSPAPSVPARILTKPGNSGRDHFGYSVAIDDDTIVAGAPLDDRVVEDKGVTYVFGPDPDGDD